MRDRWLESAGELRGAARLLELVRRLFVGVALSALTLAVERKLWNVPTPFLLVYPAVFVAAWRAGWTGAVAAIATATLGLAYLFLPPTNSLMVADSRDLIDLGIFFVLSVALTWLVVGFQRSLREARASERKFRSVFEQAAIGIGRVSFADARWTDVNDALCRILGYSRQAMLDTPWPDITHPEDVDIDLVPFDRMAAGELDSYSVEKRFLDGRDRHPVWARLTLSLVRDARGRPEYEIAIVEDIGARKAAELAVQRANERLVEADARKDDFLAMLSHELRNPLAPIRYAVEFLAVAKRSSAQEARAIDVITRQTHHLSRLIDDLLDVTRIARGKIALKREEVELDALVRATADDYAAAYADAGIALEVVAAPESIWVNADRVRVAQVIGNLLQNAAKFTPRGGRAVLQVERSERGDAVVRVRDDGVGMSRETLARAFEPFAQAKQSLDRSRGGLGLGLALVKGLVEMHGGTVSARSEGMGRGAELTFTLPTVATPTECQRSTSTTPPPRRRRHVLVVEDNADAAEELRDLLELDGNDVSIATTGRDGIDAARRIHPDVVLCDIGLPELDGYAVARALRADDSLRSTCLVALTGYAAEQDVARAVEAGFDYHLAKPTGFDRVREVVVNGCAARVESAVPT